MARKLLASAQNFSEAFSDVINKARAEKSDVDSVVSNILMDVQTRGDDALIEYSKQFDNTTLTPDTLAFPREEIDAAEAQCDANTLAALRAAANRIRSYHERQRPTDEEYVDAQGVTLGWRWTAIVATGLYVPGGTAALFSSVLMNAIPAKVAGVDRLVVVMPSPGGKINPLMLAACKIAGVDEVYRIGGAQAVAALAYGTNTIRSVDKIVGPGNAYVASAKKQVFGRVGIDMIAGPSEVTIVADNTNDPHWIAADLLAQAEHDASSQSVLITDDEAYADRVIMAVDERLAKLPRKDIASRSWTDNGAVIVVDQIGDAAALVDMIAPEHLELAIDSPKELAGRIRHAGAIFLGRHSPEALGDYIAGPSHVLPTSGTARFSSGLGVFDFLKRTSLIGCGSDGLAAIGPGAETLARAESLDSHADSVFLRLNTRRS